MYNLPSKVLLFLSAAALIFTSCAKMPDRVLSPSIKAGVEAGAEKNYSLFFTGGIKNENSSTAFLNMEGRVKILSDSGEIIATVPFKIPAILPFETGVIKEKIELKPEESVKLFAAFSISPEKLGTPEEQGTRFMEEKNIKLTSVKSEKKDILKLLGEKIK